MLNLLHIENIAVIEKADVEFTPGLNVMTGETGAGKSIVIDALTAVTGGRLSKDVVRAGAKSAVVTAVFDDVFTDEWYEESGIERDDDGQIFVTRKITSEGKNSCRINGTPVSVVQLRQLCGGLVDIHGQNDGRKLLDEAFHLKYLDGFAGDGAALADYAAAYGEFKDAENELERLTLDESEMERKIDMLKFQIEELERAAIVPGEQAEKELRRDLLKNASKLTDEVDEAYAALYGGNGLEGAAALVDIAARAVRSASRYAEDLEKIAEALTEAGYSIQDAAEELRDFKYSLDFSPQELDELEDRLSVIKRMCRKYGPSEEDVAAFYERARRELEDMEFSDERREKLTVELERLRDTAVKKAGKLTQLREKAAGELERRIASELSDLNMRGVKFRVAMEKLDAPGKNGMDGVTFLMSANAGEEPGRISKIASGGELSRIMLAMKNVLAEKDGETMVFDEIDTGVSGIAAQRVGEKLAGLSRQRQVLCVTHLPQIAAMADTQFAIEKNEAGGRTYTTVTHLDMEGRVRELARLTGGENITETTLSSAREQLQAAEKFKTVFNV